MIFCTIFKVMAHPFTEPTETVTLTPPTFKSYFNIPYILKHLTLFVCLFWGFFSYLTFPVNNCEVWVGGTYCKDKLVSNKGFICVNGTYCLNQLWRKQKKTKSEKLHSNTFYALQFIALISLDFPSPCKKKPPKHSLRITDFHSHMAPHTWYKHCGYRHSRICQKVTGRWLPQLNSPCSSLTMAVWLFAQQYWKVLPNIMVLLRPPPHMFYLPPGSFN